ncbi:MAG: VWA domain-containing protein [Candidatus Wallbacteria bacterium]
MDFAKIEFLFLFLCLPILLYYSRLILKLQRIRRQKIFSDRNYTSLSNFTDYPFFTIKLAIFFAVISFLIFSAARPQGVEKLEEYKSQSIDVCFMVDVSDSMRAMDLGNASRLEVTKYVISDLMTQLKSDRVGIIAFSGDASCICPLTLDHNAAKTLLARIDFNIIEKSGTRIDYAIEMAKGRFNKEDESAKVIILFTDGEDQEGEPLAAAQRAYKDGIRIYTIGIGSSEGVPIPISQNVWGDIEYKRYKGKTVTTKLNDDILKKIAAKTEGKYFNVKDKQSLMTMLAELKKIDKRALRSTSFAKHEELYPIFAWIAFFLIILDIILPARMRIDSVTKKIIMPVLIFFTVCAVIQGNLSLASAGTDHNNFITPSKIKSEFNSNVKKAESHIKEGQTAYIDKNYKKAAADFESAKILNPGDITANYNSGCAVYKNKDYDTAISAFTRAIESDSGASQFEPRYNRGNAYFKKEEYEQAIKDYEDALKIKPDDEDTLFNLELAKKMLEKKMQKQQQAQNGQDRKDKNSEQNKDGKDQKNGGNGGENQKQNAQQNNGQDNKDGKDKQQAAESGQDKNGGKEGQQGASENSGTNLVDKNKIEKYKNYKINKDEINAYLKRLEEDEERISRAYTQNQKNNMRRDDDDMDMFDMTPEQMMRQMEKRQRRLNGEETDEDRKKAEKKDW